MAKLVESGLGHKFCLECTRAFLNYILRALLRDISFAKSHLSCHLAQTTWVPGPNPFFYHAKFCFQLRPVFTLRKYVSLMIFDFFLIWVMPMPRYDDKEEDRGSRLDSQYPKKDAGIHEHHLTHICKKNWFYICQVLKTSSRRTNQCGVKTIAKIVGGSETEVTKTKLHIVVFYT